MSDVTFGSSQQKAVEPDSRNPSPTHSDYLMEELQKVENAERLENGTQNDGQPSTSERKTSPGCEVVIHKKIKDADPGKCIYIHIMGKRFPSFVSEGEPLIPLEGVEALLAISDPDIVTRFDDIIKRKHVRTTACSQPQQKKIMEKWKNSADLKTLKMNFPTIHLISRSDLDRMLGELRDESLRTKSENDIWNPEDRVHVVHLNFVDYCDDWLEVDPDVYEDATADGVHGYWYKNRPNMRNIECRECSSKFTPADFVTHHHYQCKNFGVVHMGLNVNNWSSMIDVHVDDRSEENMEAWKKFTMNSHRIGKRAYDEAEPQEPPKRIAVEELIDVVEIEEDVPESMETDDEDDSDYEDDEEEHMADLMGPSGSKDDVMSPVELQHLIMKKLKLLDREHRHALFHKAPEDYVVFIKEREYIRKVELQQKNWQKIREHPKYRYTATANFDNEKGKFVNMYVLDTASKATKQEIQKLEEQFVKLSKDKDLTVLEKLKKEIALLKELSPDASRVLNNQPLPPPPPAPLPKPKAVKQAPVVQPPPPISIASIVQIAQQLVASGVKLNLPQVPLTQIPVPQLSPATSTPVAATPSAPPTPVLPLTPVLPMFQNPELFKAQLQMALANQSALFPMLCSTPLKMPSFEQLSQFLKATTVKN